MNCGSSALKNSSPFGFVAAVKRPSRKSGQTQTARIAREYAEKVVTGEILACRWVQLACQRQLNDLARFKGKSSPYRFNPKLTDCDGREFHPADNLCAFIERME